MIERQTVLEVVLSCLRGAVEQSGGLATGVVEDTPLIGPGAVIDSIGLVSLIVDIEQRLEMDHHVSVTLASDRAMSQSSSPFRTPSVLADHVLATERETAAA